MQIQVNFAFQNEDEAKEFMMKFVGSKTVAAVAQPEKTETVKPAKKTVEKAPATEPVKEEVAEPETDSSEPVAFTFDMVKESVLTVSRKKGRDAALAVLAKFGIKKVGPDLPEKDYGAVVEECNKVLAA